jgi:DNA-directed RNA polymerase subunit RPC12/RpoP
MVTAIPKLDERGTLTRAMPSTEPEQRRTYSCTECGHRLRVSGLGRHRVYFELDDELAAEPVMNRVCPQCGHGLPGKNAPGSQR